MNKFMILALVMSAPFTVSAAEESAAEFTPTQGGFDLNSILAVSAEEDVAENILSTEEITQKLIEKIAASPENAAVFVEVAIKSNPGLASIELSPSLISQITQSAIQAAPEQSSAIVTAAIDSQPEATTEIVATAVQTNPENTNDIVSAALQANPDASAAIVQAAVSANTDEAESIVALAVASGANEEDMIVAALIGGADESILGDEETAAGEQLFVATLSDAPDSTDFGGGTGSGSDDNASQN